MVKVERSFPAPASLREEAKKATGRYILMRIIQSLLRRESAFAAFKRYFVRQHAKEYPQLQQYVALDDNNFS